VQLQLSSMTNQIISPVFLVGKTMLSSEGRGVSQYWRLTQLYLTSSEGGSSKTEQGWVPEYAALFFILSFRAYSIYRCQTTREYLACSRVLYIQVSMIEGSCFSGTDQ
jgi:hypothetical protein